MAYRAFSLFFLLVSACAFSGEFTSSDINTGLAGSTVSVGADGFDITGSGADVWNQSDSFRFHYQQISGDFDIRCRVQSVQNVDQWSKAGLMVRQSLAADSVHAMTVATPGNGFAFQYRGVEGGSSSHVAGGGTFYPFSWVRLIRIGQTVSGYKSVDPTADEWDLIGSTSLTTTDPVYVGLCVTAHNNSALCKAEFRNVDLHAYVPPVSGMGDGLAARYFNSRDLSGVPALSRVESQVDFNWELGSPDAAVNADNFSVRWSGQVQAQFSEEYTFYTASDDGVRLWVNGNLAVDFWTDHGHTENRSYPVSLIAGQKYDIVAEFYENGGYAEVRLQWSSRSTFKQAIPQSQLYSTGTPTPIAGSGVGLKGDYFTGREFGTRVLTRVDSTVNFDWGSGSPAPEVGSNDFAVRWTGLVEPLYTGQYTFHTVSDDGVRLWIDNQLIINNWTEHGATENSGTIALTAGKKYAVRMEFYENGGDAVAKLLWSSAVQAKEVIPTSQLYPGQGTGLFAQYFDNQDLTAPKLSRVDNAINFDWVYGSPDPLIAPDTFSVRWTGKVEPLYSESYTFYTVSDDGVRLWVNGQLVIDNWTDHSATENASAAVQLSAGQPVDIKMEFYENGGDAVAKLSWSSTRQAKQIIPATQLQPNGGMLVNFPVASTVSPAFIEGSCWSPTGQTFTINGTGAPVTMLADKRFFANLSLDPGMAVGVSFTHSIAGVSQSGSVIWTPTDIKDKDFSQHQVLLRKGDALLLTANGTNEALSIDANGDGITDFTGIAGDRFTYQFNSAGSFIADAKLNNISVGNILINVMEVNLIDPIACEIGFQRPKLVPVSPTALVSSITFTSANDSDLDVNSNTITSQGASILLRAKNRGTPILIARLGSAHGPIISFKEIDEFTISSGLSNGYVIHRDEFGFGHGVFTLRMEPKLSYVTLRIEFFVPTMTIDGLTDYYFSGVELNEGGQWAKPFLMSPESDRTCHRIHVIE